MSSEKRVIPLESNPDIFNELSYKLGLSPVLQFHDLYSLTDPDLLSFIPQPVYAIIMLFPLTETYEAYRRQTDAVDSPSTAAYANEKTTDIKWFKQTIGNACGLYALLHILANLPQDFIISSLILKDSLLRQITKYSSVEDVSRLVENLESDIQLDSNYGVQGQTAAPSAQDSVDLHFVTFIKSPHDGHLYELDGRRNGPIDLGKLSDAPHILDDPKVVEKVQFYMNNTDEKNKHNFSIMAIAPGL